MSRKEHSIYAPRNLGEQVYSLFPFLLSSGAGTRELMNTYEVVQVIGVNPQKFTIQAKRFFVDDGNLFLTGSESDQSEEVASFAPGCWASILKVTPVADCDSPPNLSQEGLAVLTKTGEAIRTACTT